MFNLAQKCIIILICLIMVVGCGQVDDGVVETAVFTITPSPSPTETIAPTVTPIPPTDTPTPIPPTSTPTATPSQTPTSTSSPTVTIEPTPTDMSERLVAPNISFANVHFTADPALGDSITGTITEDYGGEAIWFDWEGNGYCDVGQIRVWETAVLEAWDGPAPQPSDVRALLADSSADFPTWGAGIVFQAKTQPLIFQNGRGVRALLNHAQDVMIANNRSLTYEFFGLTEGGQQLIHLCFPMNAPVLLDSSIYFDNTNLNALPLPDGFSDLGYPEMVPVIQEYNREVETAVNTLNDDQFSTNLTLLDALIQSLLVTE